MVNKVDVLDLKGINKKEGNFNSGKSMNSNSAPKGGVIMVNLIVIGLDGTLENWYDRYFGDTGDTL